LLKDILHDPPNTTPPRPRHGRSVFIEQH